jgi:D-xylose ABC transporter substrate-binding protein
MFKDALKSTLFLLMILCLFASCKNRGEDKKLKVGILMAHFNSERWLKDKAYLQEAVEKMGGTSLVSNADNNDTLQFKQAKEMMAKGCNVLVVVAVNSDEASKIVEEAHKMDVKVLAYDRLIKKCDLDFYVSFDNTQVGKLQAEYLIKQAPKGDFVLVNGPTTDNNSYLLHLGQLSELQPLIDKGKVRIIYDVYADQWSFNQGYVHLKNSYERHDTAVDAVIGGNDRIARGAIKYYLENDTLNNKKVYFAGQDAELLSCQSIVQGIQTMTVYKPLKSLANEAIKIAEKLAFDMPINNESLTTINNNPNMVPALLLEPKCVHKGNIDEVLVGSGFVSKEDLYDTTAVEK